MNNKQFEEMPNVSESYWLHSTNLPTFPSLEEDHTTDVVIVGGGISGIMSAYLLTKKGYRIALLEAHRLMHGTTGYTTAKFTAQHGLIYNYLLENNGKETAHLYYEANAIAVEYAKNLINEKEIDCDFSEEPSYVFAENEEQKSKIEKEAEAYKAIGIDGGLVDTIPLDIDHEGAVVMNNQLQFNPVKFLKPLVEEIVDQGGLIVENTMVENIKTNERPSAVTREGQKVEGKYLVVCSHYPFYDKKGFYFTRLSPSRSYSLVAETTKDFPKGMYISAGQPGNSFRSIQVEGKKLVLAGGYDHPVGEKQDTKENYNNLYLLTDKTFGVKHVPYRWSAQDPATLDYIPYIGKYASGLDNVFVATGYNKWGMSTGVFAGQLLTDLISGEQSKYEELFSPLRPAKELSAKEVTKDGVHMIKLIGKITASGIKKLTKGRLKKRKKTTESQEQFSDLQVDEGEVVKYKEQRAGVYRDQQGNLHVVDTTCTHMGCEVNWNNAERTWDCPCHGSRFSYSGEVIEGPATKPLKQLLEETNSNKNDK